MSDVLIRTPDQRLRVFVSSTLKELSQERAAVQRAVLRLRLSPVMFELGARPHPPRELYRAYLAQSDVFVGVYWQRYGWVAPGETISGLEDEYKLAEGLPQLLYIKEPAPEREPALRRLLEDIRTRDQASYRRFRSPEELEERVAEDLAVLLSEQFTAARAATAEDGGRAPLPAIVTPTIARDREISEVIGILDAGTRLVTVTGPGGVGKTRVALEAAQVFDRRAGVAVYYVALASVSSPALVMGTIADRLGLRETTGRAPLDALVERFGSTSALLVLDNVEQVIAVAPELAALLERTSAVRLLVTSRQPLRIRGEHEVPIGPLATPDIDAAPDAVARAPAVELVVDRARAAGARVAVTAENAAAIAELCRRLDGLPLAIELVAARLRLLSPKALLARLDTALDLPAPIADVPARQRTLRATLNWSYDLLDADQQALFAQLAAFAGGATLDAVVEVCGQDGSADVLEILAALLDNSLVIPADAAIGAEPRLRLLQPVHDYASERLAERDDMYETRRRHFDWCCRLGRVAQPFLCGPQQREWAARFDAERPNLRTAIATGLDIGAISAVLRLVWDTLVYHYIRDGIDESRQWLLILGAHRAAVDDTDRALLDVALVIVGELPSGGDEIPLLTDAIAVFESAGLDLEAAVGRHYLGLTHWRHGDRAAAVEALEAATRRYAGIDHDWGVATVEMTLGAVRTALDELAAAGDHHRRAMTHARRIDNRPQVAQALQGLALVDARLGRIDQACDALEEAIDIVVADRLTAGASYCLEALAAVAAAREDAEQAMRLIEQARAARRQRGIPEWTAATDAVEPIVSGAVSALSEANVRSSEEQAEHDDVFALLDAARELCADVQTD